MFWGITLETTKRYTQVVADDFHVSMAALEPRGQSSKGPNSQSYISVMLEREKAEFLLCNLHPDKLIQQSLDLQFIQGEEITFFLTGEGVVHLSGYMTGGDDAEEFDEGSSDSEEEDVPNLVGKRKANQLPNKLQAKKQKIAVDSDDDDSDEDDDSDDEDEDSDSSEAEENASPKKLPQPSKGQNFKDNLVQSLQIVGSKGLQARSTPKQPQIPGGKQQQTPGGKQQQTPGGKQLQTPGGKQQQTPGGKQQGNKQTPKPGQQSPKKQQQQGQQKAKGVNGRDALDISDSLKKKRKRNKKSKGNVTLNTSDTSASPSTPAKTPAMQTPKPKPKPQKLQGGVVVEDLKAGEGKEAKPGSVVSVHYKGRFQKNNKVFDSTKIDEDEPFKFRLGRGEVIKGWDIGVQGMKVGGKRRITIPAAQAYGSKGNEAIPPNSDLVFEVDLQQIN